MRNENNNLNFLKFFFLLQTHPDFSKFCFNVKFLGFKNCTHQSGTTLQFSSNAFSLSLSLSHRLTWMMKTNKITSFLYPNQKFDCQMTKDTIIYSRQKYIEACSNCYKIQIMSIWGGENYLSQGVSVKLICNLLLIILFLEYFFLFLFWIQGILYIKSKRQYSMELVGHQSN